MPVRVRYFTDPACPASWASGAAAAHACWWSSATTCRFTYVMGGLGASYEEGPGADELSSGWTRPTRLVAHADRPAAVVEGPIGSTFPACMAVKAAAEQGPEAAERYLRAVREGLMCLRRKLDTAEALVEEARAGGPRRASASGSTWARTRSWRRSARTSRRRAARARRSPPIRCSAAPPAERPAYAGEGRTRPGARAGDRGGAQPLRRSRRPDPLATRCGASARLAARGGGAVCDLPGPRAPAELWRLAAEGRVRPVRVLTGELWEPA